MQGNLKIGLEVPYAVACVIVLPLEANTEERLLLAKQIECLGELYFSTSIRAGLGNRLPNARLQKVAPENSKPGWR